MATISSAQDGLASVVTSWGITITGTTMTFTNGSAAVLGVGTLFTTELIVNDYVIGADGIWYQVQAITDNTHLTLTGNYAGTTASPTRKLKQPAAIPVEGDAVNVYNTVTLDGTYVWGDDTITAINIKSGGRLKHSRSVNSILTAKGNVQVETGGAYDCGTVADPIPSGVYATLKLNYSAALAICKWGFLSAPSSTSKEYFVGATRTINTSLNGAISAGATSAVLHDVSGWEAGDDIVIGTSSTTADGGTKNEYVTILTINLGTKTITFAATTYAHSDGIEVSNFNSNVTITSYNTSYEGYIKFQNTTTLTNNEVQVKYAAFKYLGGTQSSVHMLYNMTGVFTNVNNFSIYRGRPGSAGHLYLYSTQPGSPVMDGIVIAADQTSPGLIFYFSNGCSASISNAYIYAKTSTIFQGANGFGANEVTLTSCKIIGGGTGFSGTMTLVKANSCEFYNMSSVVWAASGGAGNELNNCVIGTAARPCQALLTIGNGYSSSVKITDPLTYYTNAVTSVANQKLATLNYKAILANKDLDPLLQYIYQAGGNLVRDNTTTKAGASSLRFDGISGTLPVAAVFNVFAPTGKPITVSGYLRKNTSYGSSTRPYVTLSGLGISTSTYTMTDVNDTWEQFTVSGTQTTGTDGMLTFTVYFQSANASASAWIDEVSAPTPVAVNSGGFEYWANGQPASIITANYVAPIDVWNVLKTQTTLTGSMGEEVNSIKNDTALIPATL